MSHPAEPTVRSVLAGFSFAGGGSRRSTSMRTAPAGAQRKQQPRTKLSVLKLARLVSLIALTDDELERVLVERFSALGLTPEAGGDTKHFCHRVLYGGVKSASPTRVRARGLFIVIVRLCCCAHFLASVLSLLKQKRSDDPAFHRTSMTGGRASPIPTGNRWQDNVASNQSPPRIGFFVVALGRG
jgi:hypothetical protein